jgi:hypothetical protein
MVGKEVVLEVVSSSGGVRLGEAVVERDVVAAEGIVHVAVAISMEDRKACVVETDKAPRWMPWLDRAHFVEDVEVT